MSARRLELRPPNRDAGIHEGAGGDRLGQDPVGVFLGVYLRRLRGEPEECIPGNRDSFGGEIVPPLQSPQLAPGEVGEVAVLEPELPIPVGQGPGGSGHWPNDSW